MLIDSANVGDLDGAQSALEHGADVNSRAKDGSTALICTTVRGHTEIVQMLIDAGASLDIQNEYGYTALILAAANGHTEIAKMLIDAGADLSIKDNDGNDALYYAERNGYSITVDIIKKALEKQNKQRESCYVNYFNILEAIRKNNRGLVKKILKETGIKDLKNDLGQTPLMLSVNKPSIMELLIGAGLDVNCQDLYGKTALMYATEYKYPKTVKLLISNGALPDVKDKNNKTALLLGLEKYRYDHCENTYINADTDKITLSLIKAGANVNIKNQFGNTPLHEAADNCLEISLGYLLEAGADPNIPNRWGETPLVSAVCTQNFRIPYDKYGILYRMVKTLIKAGASTSVRTYKNKTLLEFAKAEERYDLVSILEPLCDIEENKNQEITPCYKEILF